MALNSSRNKQRDGLPAETSPLGTLRTEMERLFDSFLREPLGLLDWPSFMGGERWWPAVDVAESEKDLTIRAEVPGVDPKELDISVTGNQLVLSGEKKESCEKKEGGFFHGESRYGSFRRTIPLPEGLDTEHVDAQFAHGVVTLKFPKTVTASKRIEIKVKE